MKAAFRNGDIQAALALFVIALGLRLVFLWEVSDVASFRTFLPGLDVDITWRGARHLWDGRAFSMEAMALSAPVFPWLVALFRGLTGGSLLDFEVFLAVVGALRGPLLFWLCRRVGLNRTSALVATLLLQTAPAVLYLDPMPVKIGVEMTLLVGLLLLLTTLPAPTTRAAFGRGLAVGALLACMFLIQLLTFLYVVPIGVYLFLTRRGNRQLVATALPVVLLPIVAMLAFSFAPRDATSARFVGRAGVDLFIGNSADANGTYTPLRGVIGYPSGHLFDARVRFEAESGQPQTAAASDKYYRNRAIDWTLEHPGAAARLALKKIALFFNQADSPDIHYLAWVQSQSLTVRSPFGFGWMTALAMVGAIALVRARRYSLLLLFGGLVLATLAANLITFVTIRFRLPALVSLAVLAGFGLQYLWAERRGNLRTLWLPVAAFALTLWFGYRPFLEPLHQGFMNRAEQNEKLCVRAAEQQERLRVNAAIAHPSLSELIERTQLLDFLHRYTDTLETFQAIESRLNQNVVRIYIDYLMRLGRYDAVRAQLERFPDLREQIISDLRCPYREAASVILLGRERFASGLECLPRAKPGQSR